VAIESRLADRLIKAPFDGVLGLRDISPGALVVPGDLITTLDDDQVMKLDFAVPSLFLPDLRIGLGIQARARIYERTFAGTIRGIDSRVDPVTRSIQVRALISNPDRALKPGVLMQVALLRNPRDALVVPEAALLHRGHEHFVMRLGDGDLVGRRTVEIGARRPGEVEILTGLSAGDRVVVDGTNKVRAGQKVQIRAVDDGTRHGRPLSACSAPVDGDCSVDLPIGTVVEDLGFHVAVAYSIKGPSVMRKVRHRGSPYWVHEFERVSAGGEGDGIKPAVDLVYMVRID